eukprot:2705965-Pyramimonas_sp.AAC.1
MQRRLLQLEDRKMHSIRHYGLQNFWHCHWLRLKESQHFKVLWKCRMRVEQSYLLTSSRTATTSTN